MDERVPDRATDSPGDPGVRAWWPGAPGRPMLPPHLPGKRRTAFRLGGLMLACTLVAVPVRALVSEQVLEFDLPAGPLAATLIEIARQAGVIVTFSPERVGSHQAPAIRGRLTLMQAMTQALQPSGLAVSIVAGGAFSITAPATAPAPAPAHGLAAAGPAASDPAVPAGPAQLPRVEIYGLPRQSDGLRGLRGWSATRMDTALEDLPQQVSVLTNEALALQGDSSSIEATRYVPGVVLSRGIQFGSFGPGGDDAGILRGIKVRGLNASVALSGMRTVRNLVPIDNAFIERIEVVKGPTGVLSGVSDYGGRGGQVNLVRKQAGPGAHTEAEQSVSLLDGGTLRLGADVGGELGRGSGGTSSAAPGATYWRLIGYGSRSGTTEGGYAGQYGTGVLGSLQHRVGDFSAGLTLQLDRQRIAPAPTSRGGIQQADGSFTPVERGLLVPVDPGDRALVSTADLELDLAWRLGPAWRFTGKARVEAVSVDSRLNLPGQAPDLRQIDPRDAIMQAGVEHRFATGPVTHQAFIGLDLERWRMQEVFSGDGDVFVETEREYRQALTLQDLMSTGPWRLRLSAQRARIPERVRESARGRVSEPLPATNWDAGVLYRWSPSLSLYAGSQHGIETDNRRAGLVLVDGSVPPRTTLNQTQVGLKSEWLGGRLALNAEAFRMREKNRLVGVPGVSLNTVPGLSVDGAEIELTGRPRPELDLNMGLTFMTGRSQGDLALGYMPARSLRLLARYRLPESWLPDSSLGLAAMANSSTRVYAFSGTPGNPFLRLPGGGHVNLSLERLLGPWTLSAAVNNLFDRQFYDTVSNPAFVPVLPGRSATLTATFRD